MFRDKLLGRCFLASLLLNGVFALLVGNSNLLRSRSVVEALKAREIRVYKPPVWERAAPKTPAPKPKPTPTRRAARPQLRPHSTSPPPTPQQPWRPQGTAARQRPQTPSRPQRPQPGRTTTPPTSGSNFPGIAPPVPTGSANSQGQIATNPGGGFAGLPVEDAPPAPLPTNPPRPSAPPAPPPPAPPPAAEPASPAPSPKPAPRPSGPTRNAQTIYTVQPEIPDELRAEEFKSFVRVRFDIQADGSFEATLRTTSGNTEVDRLLRECLKRWKWRPALRDGAAVQSTELIRFVYENR